MLRGDFDKLAKEFEETLQHLASDAAGGVLFERLTPTDLWKRAEADVTRLGSLAENGKELMLILKPERAPAIEQRFSTFSSGLRNFREILFQNSADPLANSRLAFEQLRNAVVDGSEFLLLIRNVRDNPSPAIGEVLRLRETLESGGRVIAIEAPECVQPMLERLIRGIEVLRGALAVLDRSVSDVKERVRVLQDDSLHFASGEKTDAKKEPAKENATSQTPQSAKGQLSLSKFKN